MALAVRTLFQSISIVLFLEDWPPSTAGNEGEFRHQESGILKTTHRNLPGIPSPGPFRGGCLDPQPESSVPKTENLRNEFPIVGIGASAGGLKAF